VRQIQNKALEKIRLALEENAQEADQVDPSSSGAPGPAAGASDGYAPSPN